MRLIFLDIDGVLITAATCRAGFGIVDPVCVSRLNRLVVEADAKLVLSSAWRTGHTLIENRERLINWGVKGDLVGKTPHLHDIRGAEIQQWIDQSNRTIESFVILDDDRDMGELLPRLIHTSFTDGLQDHHVETAISMLKGTPCSA